MCTGPHPQKRAPGGQASRNVLFEQQVDGIPDGRANALPAAVGFLLQSLISIMVEQDLHTSFKS
ncbi:MAG: hypothetical protein V9G10_04225 [Candidatus Nanopelagicales bacterium]